MCKTCVKPIYGGVTRAEWGSVISTSQYDSPLDLSREKDAQKPRSPTQLKHRTTGLLSITDTDPSPQAPTPHQLDEKTWGSASKLDTSTQHSTPAAPEEVFESEISASSGHEVRPGTGEVGTLTEIHTQDNVAEVDLISLVEEQIPKYVLRADTLTDFAGYDNQDFACNPALPADTDLDLSSELVEETLKYFVLCSERLSQMTKTYHDIEAVTRLLEEKESDLELAARIGQGLLEKNKALKTKNESLEEILNEATEKISQLRHELTMKEAMLQMYREDIEHSTSPQEEVTMVGVFDSDILNKKVKQLEEENLQLKLETADLAAATDTLEEQEMHLVNDCVQELDTVNRQVRQLHEELNTKADVCHRQQEENTSLLSKLLMAEGKCEKQLHENEDLRHHVLELQTTQMELTQELGELEERYEECVSLLHEKQGELKTLRKKAAPSVIHQHYGTSPFFMPEGSLALELEKSQTEECAPEENKAKNRRHHMSRVLETAKTVRVAMDRASSSTSLASSVSMWSEEDSSLRSSLYTTDIDSDSVDLDTSSHVSFGGLGKPGVPGSNDLETALRRLTTDEQNNQLNRSMQEALDKQREDDNTPTPCPTPDSYLSTGSGALNTQQHNNNPLYRIPEKLQIVKPMEGSLTLHHWQKLATPRLEGVLESRPGVQIRGHRSLELEEEVYSITDIEEDDDLAYLMAKSAEETAATFTYTTSKVMHPTHNCSPNSKLGEQLSVQEPVIRPSSLPLQQNTPASHATSTYSMNTSLATVLGERGADHSREEAGKGTGLSTGLMSRLSKWLSAPRRFNSLVTETPVLSRQQSHTDTVYSQASMYVPPLPGINAKPMPHRPDAAYLQLVSKIGQLGPANILSIAERTGISPVKQDPVDVGLNTMMFIRRNRINGILGLKKGQTLLDDSGKTTQRGPHAAQDAGLISRTAINTKPVKSGLNLSTAKTGLNQPTPVKTGLSHGQASTTGITGCEKSPAEGIGVIGRTALSYKLPVKGCEKSPVVGMSVISTTAVGGDQTTSQKQVEGSSGEEAVLTRTVLDSSQASHDSLISSGERSLFTRTDFDSSHVSSHGSGPALSSPETDCFRGSDESVMSSKEVTLGLHTGPVCSTSVAGLSYAVSPPSIHSAGAARENVYVAKSSVSGGNVGTGTIHSPSSRRNTRLSNLSTSTPAAKGGKGVIASAEARMKLLGEAVRSRESCHMIGGLTSTPLHK